MNAINSSEKIAATLYFLGTLFVSAICIQIPCIKEIVILILLKGTPVLPCTKTSRRFPRSKEKSSYRIKNYKPTETSLTINRTSQYLIMRKGHCLLKDAAISGDRNVIKTK
jgi:hypothetical protein